MMTWEGVQLQGAEGIVEKLQVRGVVASGQLPVLTYFITQSLPFSKVVHQVTTVDAQPSSTSVASLLVSVIGLLKVSVSSVQPTCHVIELGSDTG